MIQWFRRRAKRRLLSYLERFVCHRKPLAFGVNLVGNQKPLVYNHRREISSMPLEEDLYCKVLPPQQQTHTIYPPIGVGVYRGEFVAIQEWAWGTDNSSRPWLVYGIKHANLQSMLPQLLHDIQGLLCLLCQYQYDKHFSLVKMDLQTQGEPRQETYFCEHKGCTNQQHSSEGEKSNPVSASQCSAGKVSGLSQQLQQRCPYSQVYQD